MSGLDGLSFCALTDECSNKNVLLYIRALLLLVHEAKKKNNLVLMTFFFKIGAVTQPLLVFYLIFFPDNSDF